jgi:hypothetical protein
MYQFIRGITLSRIVSKTEKRMREDESYQEKIMQYNNTITQDLTLFLVGLSALLAIYLA